MNDSPRSPTQQLSEWLSRFGAALDWKDRFRDAVAPVFTDLYNSVAAGKETEIVLRVNSAHDYREKLQKELDVIKNSEMWQAGAAVRALRPERRKNPS